MRQLDLKKINEYKFISFDVFDTLITRRTYSPYGIFSIVQKKLQNHDVPDIMKNTFCEMRIFSEQMAVWASDRIITIDDIYRMMLSMNDVNAEDCELAKKLEIEEELKNVVPIPENITMLKNIIESGKVVVLISDMYLQSKIIRKMLCKADSIFQNIPLYISCEYNASKYKRSLYEKVLIKYNIEPENWMHIGDNIVSDYTNVNEIGGKAFQYNRIRRNNYLLNLGNKKNDYEHQIIYGAIKNTIKDDKPVIYNWSAAVAGPVLFLYTMWVVKKSQQKNIEHLFFIARDGYLLKKIADIIIYEQGLPIKTSYLYCSRKTLYPVEADQSITTSDLLRNYELTIEELKDIEEIVGLHDLDKLDLYQLGEFEKLYINFRLRDIEHLKSKAIERRKTVLSHTEGYLRQEIGNERIFALIDMQGRGSSHEMIWKILGDDKINIFSFYFSLFPGNYRDNKKHRFFTLMNHLYDVPGVLEAMSRAPHGITIDYIYKDKWEPVLAADKDFLDSNLFNEYERGVIDFAQILVKYDWNNAFNYEIVINEIIEKLCSDPSIISQKMIGDMPFESEYLGGPIVKFGPKLPLNKNMNTLTDSYKGASIHFSRLRVSDDEKIKLNILKNKENSAFIESKLSTYPINKDIILYGAGKRGKRYYSNILDNPTINLIAWVDKHPRNNVQDISIINNVNFDYIVIAIADKITQKEVKKMLNNIGISNDKIILTW